VFNPTCFLHGSRFGLDLRDPYLRPQRVRPSIILGFHPCFVSASLPWPEDWRLLAIKMTDAEALSQTEFGIVCGIATVIVLVLVFVVSFVQDRIR
jgi:hypothetical protein